jgi:hypothetical protein
MEAGRMSIIRVIALVIGVVAFIVGGLMVLPDERGAGQALVTGGAIIIAGALIALAIGEARK